MDPRPLTAEPLALDLVNTVWIEEEGRRDLFEDTALTEAWLARWELSNAGHIVEARTAIRQLLEHPGPKAEAAVDAILGRGRIVYALAGETLEVEPEWEAAWYAASDLRNLLADRPDRLKRCANPDCVLWFADTTRSNTRRWCSMTGGCGSRLKARRHAERTRA